jgi:hypothetical protein
MLAANVRAVMGPTPETLINRLQTVPSAARLSSSRLKHAVDLRSPPWMPPVAGTTAQDLAAAGKQRLLHRSERTAKCH